MTPGARVQATIELLEIIAKAETSVASTLENYFRKRRYAGSGDRRDVTGRVYDVLRRRARLDWWIGRTGLAVDASPRSRVLSHLAIHERRDPDTVAMMFSGNRHCPAALTGVEEGLLNALYARPPMHGDMPVHVRQEAPDWLEAPLRALWGDDFETEMAALNQTAPLDLRVNVVKATRERVQSDLAAAGVEARSTPLSPRGLRVEGKARLGAAAPFKQGWFDVQDEGSQLLALLSDARPGETVVDFCAGAGGKTLALGAEMWADGRLKGRLIACDVSGYRLNRMDRRLKRAGLGAVIRQVVAAKNDPWVADHREQADRVLVDAPCSGSGAWRRDPEAKWRIGPQDITELVEKQRRILTEAAPLAAPGGRLIYATCSLFVEENEAQADWFQAAFPDFEELSVGDVWDSVIGGARPAGLAARMRLSPAKTATDGFFLSIFQRRR